MKIKNEIKFRAWEKQLKEIIPVKNIDLEAKIINRKGAWRFFHEIELMQSTGLRDKNGVEIYEGDILSDKKFSNVRGAVVYRNGKFMCIDENSLYEDLDNYEMEVIGNIYENKKLSEGK